MSNKTYFKRLKRIAKQRHCTIAEAAAMRNPRLVNHGDLQGIGQLYKVADQAEKQERQRKREEVQRAHIQRSREKGQEAGIERMVQQDQQRKAKVTYKRRVA